MKKLLVVLLSLGLIVAFSMSASAADVKFSGQYYVVGVYNDNLSLAGGDDAYSRAYIWNRARVQMVFKIADGLTFTTRFDAFEKQWGNTNWSGGSQDKSNSAKAAVAGGSPKLQENLEMEHGYVTFKTAMGQFQIGYQAADTWGTVFGDNPGSRPRVKYILPVGPLTILAIYEKVFESDGSYQPGYGPGTTDADWDNYALAGVFKWKGGNAGLLLKYIDNCYTRVPGNYGVKMYAISPYVMATFGPVYVEGQVYYLGGKAKEYDNATYGADVDKESLAAYALAKVKLGPAFVGGQIGYSQGQDPNDKTKDTVGQSSSTAWNPTLIWGQANLNVWAMGGVKEPNKQNLLLYNVFGGFNVTPKVKIEGAVSMMWADQTAAGVDKAYGTEIDVQASYKIYDNLTYLVGAGYLVAGDFYKGAHNAETGDDYLLMNKLTVKF